MKQSTKFGLVSLAALACLTTVQQVRPRLPGSFLLGVLPNTLAAIIIPFVFISIYVEQRPAQTRSQIIRWFIGAALGACVGLIAWELMQRSGRRLIFDWNDVFATIAGFAIAIFIAVKMLPRGISSRGQSAT